jgi:hypothetical protein
MDYYYCCEPLQMDYFQRMKLERIDGKGGFFFYISDVNEEMLSKYNNEQVDSKSIDKK